MKIQAACLFLHEDVGKDSKDAHSILPCVIPGHIQVFGDKSTIFMITGWMEHASRGTPCDSSSLATVCPTKKPISESRALAGASSVKDLLMCSADAMQT